MNNERMIILANAKGEKRYIPSGQPYRKAPDEVIVGVTMDDRFLKLKEELAEEGMELGDFVKAAIELIPESVRPKHCSACDKRKLALNEWSKQGKAFLRKVKAKIVG